MLARGASITVSLAFGLLLALGSGCQGRSADPQEMGLIPAGHVSAEDLMVVDCLLPGQVRKLGRSQVFMTPRRPVRTSAHECEIRGGEYVAYDRADYRTALRVWLADAEKGDAKSQNYVGEIYEKGLGTTPQYEKAAAWYRKAADQGHAPAMVNLGQLHERGLGVPKDWKAALGWYRRASGLADLGVEYVTVPETPGDDEADSGAPAQALAGPSLYLVEPPIPETRGLRLVLVGEAQEGAAPKSRRTVAGRVVAPAGVQKFLVNDVNAQVDEDGRFSIEVPLRDGPNDVVVSVIDRHDKRAERRFQLFPDGRWSTGKPGVDAPAATASRLPKLDFGHFHALVIGNESYSHLPILRSAIDDAEAVGSLLEARYGFEVTLLRDATRYDILSSLNRLRASLTEEDNLLIYYAGHGELDEVNMRGHWLPVDAERESTANWISNVAITDILNAMSARHVMVVSDSCYSGALTRSALAALDSGMTDEARLAWIRAIQSKRSRTALTSGGLAPVLDEGSGRHSVFAKSFLEVLSQNRSFLEGQRFHQELSARVTYAAESYRFEQVPEYAPIKFAGHESGDFVFVPRDS